MSSDNRTESATPKRRAETRKKGQVARSTEITSVAVLFTALAVLNSRAGDMVNQYAAVTRSAFLQVGAPQERPEALLALAASLVSSGMLALAPLAGAVAIAGISSNLLQVGPLLSADVLKPDFNRINPVAGIKRLWSTRVLVELVKAAAKASVLGFVAYQVIRERFWIVVGLQAASPEGVLAGLGGILLEVGQKCGLALLVMAVADYAYQRHSHEEGMKMSKDQIKEETRQSEGDPHVKSKLRALQRKFATRRMMQSVPHADVVVTNPTHFAVALEYKPPKMQAPVVVAKGQELVAAQIRRVAAEHGVPVVENPPLARGLYASVEIGSSIPPTMYQAVAEVLAFIYRLREEKNGSTRDTLSATHRGAEERETPWL